MRKPDKWDIRCWLVAVVLAAAAAMYLWYPLPNDGDHESWSRGYPEPAIDILLEENDGLLIKNYMFAKPNEPNEADIAERIVDSAISDWSDPNESSSLLNALSDETIIRLKNELEEIAKARQLLELYEPNEPTAVLEEVNYVHEIVTLCTIEKELHFDAIKYKCEGVCFAKEFWWFDNGFHYKVDKSEDIYSGVIPSMIPDWGMVCNSETEKYIKENCTPPFLNEVK